MEVKEGATHSADDVIFQRIGVSIPVIPSNHKFDSHSAPLQALAVSNRFGLTFIAHPQGFCVAKTAQILCLAKEMKDNPGKALTVRELSIVDVPLMGVRILSLSNDGLILAACVEGSVHFFAVHDLVQKVDVKPFHSELVHEAQCVKEFLWSTATTNAFTVLLSEGVLFGGKIGASLKCIEEKVSAADWSADGQCFALVIGDDKLIILSSEFEKKFHVQLPAQLQSGCADNGTKIHVDSIKWVRSDSIIIGCVGVNKDEEEVEYLTYLLTSRSGDLSKELVDMEIFAFNTLFTSIDESILPPNTGPYLLVNYLSVWELAVVANRRNIDDHIVLLGWMQVNGKKEPSSLEIINDKWLPRIELQENGDENLMVGIAMDRTSVDSQISIPLDDGGLNELPPCPVLLCMTIEGKLNLFSFARTAEVWHATDLVLPPPNAPIPHPKALMDMDKEVSNILVQSCGTAENAEVEEASSTTLDSKALMGMGKEVSNILVQSCAAAQNSEAEESSSTTLDSMTVGTNEAKVNAKTCQVGKKEIELVKGEECKTFHQEKASDTVKPLPEEKSTSVTLGTKEVDTNIKTIQVVKQEHEMGKGQDFNTFQVQNAGDVTKPMPDEKPGAITLGTREVDVNTKKSEVSNQDHQVAKVEDSNKIPVQKTSDVIKITHDEKATFIGNKSQENEGIRNPSGIFSTVPRTGFQNAPPKISPLECSSSPFANFNASPCTKVASQVGTFKNFGSVSVRTNETHTVFSSAGTLTGQNVAGKTNLVGPSKGNMPGKGSFQKDVPGSLPVAGSGTGSFGFMQSSGHLPNSNALPLKLSAAGGGLVPMEGNKETKHEKNVVGAFGSHNVPGTTLSDSRLQPGWNARVSSATALEDSHDKIVQENMQKSSERFLKPLGTTRVDVQSSCRPSGISDTEADFSRELEKVRNMAKEIDDLFLYIEGGNMMSKADNVSFRKHLVMSIEDGMKNLLKNCKMSKESIEQQVLDVQNLCDKIMQVVAWRIYMESLVKQAADSQYQELRNCQKLNPELDMKRQHIMKAEQRLKHQILELERHLQNLEINTFEEVNDSPRRGHQKQLQNARQLKSLQSFYNTVNSQLAVAEQLAEYLSQQMEALNISSTLERPGNARNTTKESLFRSIGLSPEKVCFQTPDVKEKGQGLFSLQNSACSPAFSASSGIPVQKLSGACTPQESETATRRRDPIDSAWANVGATKTTVKRGPQAATLRASRDKPLMEPTLSKISQLRASPSSQAPCVSGRKNPAIGSSKSPNVSSMVGIQRNIGKLSTGMISSETSLESFFNQSNYDVQSSVKIPTQAATAALKSPATHSNSNVSPNVDGDKLLPKDISFSTINLASDFLESKPRSVGIMVGTQSEGFSGFKPSTMQTTSTSTAEVSFDLPKAKSSAASVLQENASSVEMGSKIFPKPKDLFFVESKPVHGNLGTKTSESDNIALVPVASFTKFGQSSPPFSLAQESILSALPTCTAEPRKSPVPGVPGSFSDVASTSSSAILAESDSGRPFLFSMGMVNASSSQKLAVSSSVSLSSVETRTASNPLQAAYVTGTTAGKTGTMNAQVHLPFVSKPANILSTEASSQPKPFPVGVSLSTSGTQCKVVSSDTISTTKMTSLPLTQSSRSQVPEKSDHSLEALGSASGVQPCSEETTASQLGLSSFTTSSSQILAASSAASSNSSSAQISASQVLPLVSTSPQPNPLFVGFSTAPAAASSPAFSFPLSTTPGFGQFPASVSGLSGFGSQVSAVANTSVTVGFSSSSSIPLSSEQSPTTYSFGQGITMIPSEQKTTTASVSGSPAFGSQISAVSGISASIGFPSSSSMPLSPQHNQTASSFGQSIGLISPERKTLSSFLVNAPTIGQSLPAGSSLGITPAVSNEEDMEEATTQISDTNFGGFSGFGLGSATPTTPKSNPFGGPLITGLSSPAFSMSVPTGELFRPASFSIPAAQSSPQSSGNLFSGGFGGGGGISPAPATASSFGQPAQPGPGQQALGSALGAFGQSRQLGLGSGFGAGFGSPSAALGSGFAAAASGGGFAAVASGGRYAGAANAAGAGFAGAGTGGGFQSFSGNQGGGFSTFGSGSPGLTNAPSNLFTQIRK